jgi:uncharacterized damage-inducible protein DinB
MDPFLASARTTLDRQRRAFEAVIAGLPPEALDWQPTTGANSLAVLVTHAWGSAQGWMARAAGREVARDRAAEFRARGDAAALRALLREGGARIEAALDAIDPATLGRVCFRESDPGAGGEEYTVARCVLHAVEHAQEHLGQSWLTRQLWEARPTGPMRQ